MSDPKSFLRFWTPHGLIEHRRRKFRLRRLGLSPKMSEVHDLERAVNECHFDLWPNSLRQDENWTLVDVGANEGDFIRATLRLSKPATIIAVEPLPSCQPALSKLLATVRASRLVAAAAGAATGELELHCTGDSKLSSLLSPRRGIEQSYKRGDFAVQETFKVPIVRLDDVVSDTAKVGLLKIDVQGYEMNVLRGALRTLSQTHTLLIEVNFVPHYEEASGFDELHAFLTAAGFRLYGMSPPYFDRGRPLWADAAYVRGESDTW